MPLRDRSRFLNVVIGCIVVGICAATASAQCEQSKLLADDGAASDDFGLSVSISGEFAIVGARWDDGDEIPYPSNSGSAYVFRWAEGAWMQVAKLDAGLDVEAGDEFGASVGISGDYAIVGAEFDNDQGLSTGSAYIFSRSGDVWGEDVELAASDAAEFAHFGRSVAIDGNVAAVSAVSASGSVYVFERTGLDWVEEDELLTWDGSSTDKFGDSVAVSGDYILVGAPGERDPDIGYSVGAAYVFERTAQGWVGRYKLTAGDAAQREFFGGSVSISGNWAVVGADRDDDSCPEEGQTDCGAAYVFMRVRNVWQEKAKLTPPDTYPGHKFGRSVAIDGDYIVVGTEYDHHSGTDSGAAYVFVREGEAWIEQAKLTATDADSRDEFGACVAISGNRVLIGAPGDDPGTLTSTGSGYSFARTAASWGVHADGFDLSDVAHLQNCFTDTGVWDLSPCCWLLDSDDDEDVDREDYVRLYDDLLGP
jgi:hypothetical protein